MPRLVVVSGHAHALLGSGVEFVEQVSIDANAGRDNEIAGRRISLSIGIADASESDSAKFGPQAGLGCGRNPEGNPEIMGQCIGGADRNDSQRSRSICQDLNEIVDCAVAAAGKNGVATGGDAATSFFTGVLWGIGGNEVGFYALGPQRGNGGIQLTLALLAAAG